MDTVLNAVKQLLELHTLLLSHIVQGNKLSLFSEFSQVFCYYAVALNWLIL